MTMQSDLSRRNWLKTVSTVTAGACLANCAAPTQESFADETSSKSGKSFRFCLNTSTIRGQNKSLPEEIDIAAKAGYNAIEPWTREIDAYVKEGGVLSDLKKRIQDVGMTVESAIGFANWIVDDDAKRAEALESMKRDMDNLRQIGGVRIAAPPVGATDNANLDLRQAAIRYRALLELGRSMEVTPQLELWGFSKTLSRLGELAFVSVESGHPDACLLTDVYHIYKGGSDFCGLKMINHKNVHVIHMNDYPAMDREKITDADRVYPGDGVAPIKQILTDMRDAGFSGVFSLELFNREYWKQDAAEVARTGLEKMKEVVAKALA